MDRTARLLCSNAQYVRFPLSTFVASAARQSLRRLDFVPQVPHFWCGHTGCGDTARLKRVLEQGELQTASLTPPPYGYSITAPAGKQREATFAYSRVCIGLARALGCDRVVLGAAGACWDLPSETLAANACGMLQALCEEAGCANVTLLLCPVMGPDTPLLAESPVLGRAEEIADMLELVGSPWLAAALDTNVMSAWGEDIPGWFARLGGSIRLVRLTDGNYHGWRAWGEGCLPMRRYRSQLDEAGYTGDLSLLLPGDAYQDKPDYPEELALRALTREE